MIKYLQYLIVCLFIVLGPQSRGQQYPMRHFTKDNGLPSNIVYNLHYDSYGFLWVATKHGIARYNGINFEVFTTDNGLPDNEIFFFKEDRDHRLWLASYNGELCYYKDGIFHNAENTPWLKLPFKSSYIRNISVESDNSVSIYFFDRSKFINIKGSKIEPYSLDILGDKAYDRNSILLKKKLKDGAYSIVTPTAAVDIYNYGAGFKIDTSFAIPKFVGVPLWLFVGDVEYFFDANHLYDSNLHVVKQFANPDLLKQHVYGHYFDKEGNTFSCTADGVVINDNIRTLRGNKVNGVTQSSTGDFWFCTLNNGIFFMDNQLDDHVYDNVYTGEIKYTHLHKDELYFASGNYNIYKYQAGAFNSVFDFLSYAGAKKISVPDDSYRAAFLIDSSLRFFGINGAQKLVIDNLKSAHAAVKLFNAPRAYNISTLLMHDGKIIFERPDYLAQVAPSNFMIGSFSDPTPFVDETVIRQSILSERLFNIAENPGRGVWFASEKEMYKIIEGKPVAQKQFGSLQLKYFCFFGDYLIGYTHGNQLLICKDIDGKIEIDSVRNQNCVWDRFFSLDATHVLMSTNNLYRVIELGKSAAETRQSITVVENPLVPLIAEDICSDGKNCFFFRKGSVIKMGIASVLTKPELPKLFFNRLKTDRLNLPIADVMTVSYNRAKHISVSYLPISFNSSGVTYAYSISGTDVDNWRYTNLSEIELANPDYGTYVIKVKARTVSGGFCEPISFILVIEKPIWATWWFITLCTLGIIVLVFFTVRYRIKMELRKRDKEFKKEIRFLKSEYKALNALMNPHFIFNTLNNVQSLINKDEKRAANEYLRIFSNLIRQNMHNISLEQITIREEMDLVVNYLKLEKLRFKEHLNYEVIVDEKVDLTEVKIPPLLIQPLVENSIKHGLFPRKSVDSFIQIHIFEKDNFLIIEVKDNGIGITASQKTASDGHQSFGLENIRKRIQQVSIIQNRQLRFDFAETIDPATGTHWTVVTVGISLS